MLKTIIAQLKLGSIKTVLTRGNYISYPAGQKAADLVGPFVLVYDDYPLNIYYSTINTIKPFIVEVRFPPGYITEVDEYIEHEVIELLDRKRLTTDDGYTFQVFATASISPLEEPNDDRTLSSGNDDKTIGKKRRFFVPRRGA